MIRFSRLEFHLVEKWEPEATNSIRGATRVGAFDTSSDYYRLREEQERDMAEKAKDPASRAIHIALAEKYQALAEGAFTQPSYADEDELPSSRS